MRPGHCLKTQGWIFLLPKHSWPQQYDCIYGHRRRPRLIARLIHSYSFSSDIKLVRPPSTLPAGLPAYGGQAGQETLHILRIPLS